jgi:hypothetical protein
MTVWLSFQISGFLDFHFIKVNEFTAILSIMWESSAAAQEAFESFRATWFSKHFSPYLVDENRQTGQVIVSFS